MLTFPQANKIFLKVNRCPTFCGGLNNQYENCVDWILGIGLPMMKHDFRSTLKKSATTMVQVSPLTILLQNSTIGWNIYFKSCDIYHGHCWEMALEQFVTIRVWYSMHTLSIELQTPKWIAQILFWCVIFFSNNNITWGGFPCAWVCAQMIAIAVHSLLSIWH